jgi:hypothetical protein
MKPEAKEVILKMLQYLIFLIEFETQALPVAQGLEPKSDLALDRLPSD